jgi:hypothetical protein
MAGCGRGRVIAHPASAGFCSPQVKLTTPAAHFGIDGFRDLLECQGAVRSADKNPSFRRFDVFGERLEEAATNPPRRSHPLGLPLPLSPYALRRGADIDGIRPGSQVRVGDPGVLSAYPTAVLISARTARCLRTASQPGSATRNHEVTVN